MSVILENTKNILEKNALVDSSTTILLLYDEDCILSQQLAQAYKENIQPYKHYTIKFSDDNHQEVLDTIDLLKPKDLVVLVQSTSFRMSKYRFRVELFHKGIKVIEHAHLAINKDEEAQTYINALTYEAEYYQNVSEFLKQHIDPAQKITVEGNGAVLMFEGGFEEVKKNIGDWSQSVNVGGRFPIGEIFTEAKDITRVNGNMLVYAYPDMELKTKIVEPFKATVKDGSIISHEGPKEFEALMNMIREENNDGRVPIREIGLGLNRHISKEHPLNEIQSFERLVSLHLSLGMKHGIYSKKIPKQVNQRYHIDIFVESKRILADETVIFENGHYPYQ